MAGATSVDALTVGVACPLGARALDTLTSLRANLRSVYRLEDGDELEARHGEAIRASRSLELGPGLSRSQRASAYAQQALHEAASPFGAHIRGVPLFLATPEGSESAGFEVAGLFGDLAASLGSVSFYPGGRAGLFEALAIAREGIERGAHPVAIVGGVDSLADRASVARLAEAGALLGARNPDGLIPGEGAAFLVLARSGMALPDRPPLARLGPVCLGHEAIPLAPAPVSEGRPAPVSEAEGLTTVLAALRRSDPEPIDALHSAQPPQRRWGRELAFVVTRHQSFMADGVAIHRPAEALGDLGAAAGAVALSMAVLGFHALIPGRAHAAPRPKRALVYGQSDAGQVGATIVSAIRWRPHWS